MALVIELGLVVIATYMPPVNAWPLWAREVAGVPLQPLLWLAAPVFWPGVAVAEAMESESPAAVHRALLGEGRFPSASECRNCHPNHYEEWSASQHAYAQLSPVFNAMHGTLLERTNGTLGDFCIR